MVLVSVISARGALQGLLMHKTGPRVLSAGRVQVLVVTILVLGIYATTFLMDRRLFPSVDSLAVGALAASHAVYLAEKAVWPRHGGSGSRGRQHAQP